MPANNIALIYAGLGRRTRLLPGEKAYEEHSFQMQWLKVEPRWDSLRFRPALRRPPSTRRPAANRQDMIGRSCESPLEHAFEIKDLVSYPLASRIESRAGSNAYIDKGMFAQAVAEAPRARELSGVSSQPVAYAGYALAKSGKDGEARAELDGLLKLSTQRYVPPYHIAFLYSGLNERDKTLAWLERGYEQRDPKMVFLKVDPKWNNLRSDPRFQDLLRRMRFEP